jgi:hypothetical protein
MFTTETVSGTVSGITFPTGGQVKYTTRLACTSATKNGTTLTVTVPSGTSGFKVGQKAIISALAPDVYNGEATIAAVTSTTVSVYNTNTATITDAAGFINPKFPVGSVINISDVKPANFTVPDAIVLACDSVGVTIASAETGSWISDGKIIYDELKNHTISSSTIRTQTLVLAEWNLNLPSNIAKIGNYRYRPTVASPTEANFGVVAASYDDTDALGAYTNATYADVLVDGGFEDDGTPYFIQSQNQKQQLLMSLEDCFGKNRPRSGINKLMYFPSDKKVNSSFPGRKIPSSNPNMALRPRYFVASRDDVFKYWCSFRAETTGNNSYPRGISFGTGADKYIDDAAPFVVYTDSVPANRVVVKMQTHIGSYDTGNNDPLYGDANKQTPLDWKIQKLVGTTWTTIKEYVAGDTRADGTPIIKEDGYVELSYGAVIPAGYETTFYYAGDYASVTDLPVVSTTGYGYLVGADSSTPGDWYVYNGSGYDSPVEATYAWNTHEETINRFTPFATQLVDAPTYGAGLYREVDYLDGLRIVVKKMTKQGIPFDLIELSPRLAVDLSDKTLDFSIKKHASDLGSSGMPVGQLLAGTGDLNLFDYDQAFNPSNTDSIVNKFIARNLQIKMYEIVVNVNGSDYYMPIRTMNCEGFPSYTVEERTVSLQLRDQFLAFESVNAPEIFVRDVSLSFAISTLLDSIGFSNYIFKRTEDSDGNPTPDPIIPYFFIPPQTSVAEVLQDLAVSTQHMMFFDEYNNFVVMSKEYAMPTLDNRSTDFVLYGSQDYTTSSDLNNTVKVKNTKLSNIISIASQFSDIYNDGKINYSAKHIQRSIAEIRQGYNVDNKRTWVYKPVLLWEAPAQQNTKSINQINNQSSGYALTAIPLNTTLSATVPSLSGGAIINNIIDLGEGTYWMPRYNGYFYANGEIIKYDAVEYIVDGIGTVWISSVLEYSNYFSKLAFAKTIYPSGRVRIYAKVNKDGTAIERHGRGQFGTTVVQHNAGLDSSWSLNTNRLGFQMEAKYLFDAKTPGATVGGDIGVTTNATNLAQKSASITGQIKNVLVTKIGESTNEYIRPKTTSEIGGSVQSSALVFSGPALKDIKDKKITPRNLVTYIPKELTEKYVHFGTRLRIIGRPDNVKKKEYYTVQKAENGIDLYDKVKLTGGSAGIAFMLDTSTDRNNGYYFEISALSYGEADTKVLDNVFFYKVKKASGASSSDAAIPVALYSGQATILVDEGEFVGQGRAMAERHPTVYDLNVEYEIIGSNKKWLRFYLYINNTLIATVDDKDALPIKKHMALFVRGSTKAMFENISAMRKTYANDPDTVVSKPPVQSRTIFDDIEISTSEALRTYAISGLVQQTMLSNVRKSGSGYDIYFDEFGTIMREAAYFNIKYDKAYPALTAKISPTLNPFKGYTVSGFAPTAYGAEFMVFNCTDNILMVGPDTGNYLRIQGVTLTDDVKTTLSVDEYYDKRSDFSNPVFSNANLLTTDLYNEYVDIKNSRTTYGVKSFDINAKFIQDQDVANNMMGWLISKMSKPRKAVGLETFGTSFLQLGDIVKINYTDSENVEQISADSRYVLYSSEYRYGSEGPQQIIYLSEVQ